MNLLIKDLKFDKVMSREARRLRDEVLSMCIQYGGESNPIKQDLITERIKKDYDPIVWERAILYASSKQLITAIKKRTSKVYYNKEDDSGDVIPEWKKGKADGVRYKNIDWYSVSKFDPSWWVNNVQFKREGSIHPSSFDKIRDIFEDIYTLFVNWLIVDFSYDHLYKIFHISTKHSVEFVHSCMSKIDDNDKKSVDYLISVMEREYGIMKQNIMEREDLTAHSKKMLGLLTEMVKNKETVDWSSIDKDIEVESENIEEFDRVKLS